MKQLKYYPNYFISEDGQIWSNITNKYMTPVKHKLGYMYVSLYVNKKQFKKTVHRLVAETFLENLEGKKDIDHLDGNKENNSVSNLEWVDHKENIRRAWKNEQFKKTGAKHLYKPVICIETGEIYISASIASKKLGLTISAVSGAILRQGTAGGFHWSYK